MSVLKTTSKGVVGLNVAKAAAKRPGVLKTAGKGALGLKAAKAGARHPNVLTTGAQAVAPIGKVTLKASKPLLKRRARHRAERMGETAERLGDAARRVGEALVRYGPEAAYELGLAEPPRPKRTAPRVAAGIVIGAGAMYLLEPEHGREHRQKLAQLVG